MNSAFNHLKILFLLLAFAAYVSLELAFNLLLVDTYSQSVSILFGELHLKAESLELFGRTLSSFGLAMAIISFTSVDKFSLWSASQDDKARGQKSQLLGKWLVRPLVFIALWIALIPIQRLLIDGWVQSTSNEDKLSAVRAIVYKEGYLANRIAIDGFDDFNAIAQDPERRDLVVALIPSLAYFSKSFNSLIEQNSEIIADHYLTSEQKQQFAQQGLPRLRRFDDLYFKEWQIYENTLNRYNTALAKLSNSSAIEAETARYIEQANSSIRDAWNLYARLSKASFKAFDELSKNEMLYEQHHKFKDRFKSSRCDSECRQQVRREHANFFNNLTYESGVSLDLKVLPEHILFTFEDTKGRIEIMLRRGRQQFLKEQFGVGEEEELEEYINSDGARLLALKTLRDQGITLPSSWQLSDTAAITNALRAKYRRDAETVWVEYTNQSEFDIPDKNLGIIDFATHPILQQKARTALGNFYINSYSRMPESEYFEKWLAQQDNLSFIRMVTSTAATAAFSPGGVLFDIGNDAVMLAVVPPLSIGLSFLAILLLCMKMVWYLKKHSVGYLAIVAGGALFFLILPTVQSLTSGNSYHVMMANFAETFHKDEPNEKLKTVAFGYVLDFENSLFEHYKDLAHIDVISELLVASSQASDTDVQSGHQFSLLRRFDNWFYHHFSWIPGHLSTGNIVAPFDANITVLKRDNSVGAFLGLYLKNQQITQVKMPNFLAGSDLGLLLEQRIFANRDIGSAAKTFINNYDNPAYLQAMAEGNVFKSNAIEKLENTMTRYLKKNQSFTAAVAELKQSGYPNLIMLQANRGEAYRCVAMKNITSSMLSRLSLQNSIDKKELNNCEGFL